MLVQKYNRELIEAKILALQSIYIHALRYLHSIYMFL